MKARQFLVAAAVAATWLPASSWAHEVPNIAHTHAFQQTGYGTYRVGHSVNGPLGSITIWSPQTYTEYQAGKTVKFARPTPITTPPGSPKAVTKSETDPVKKYGKR